MEDIIKLRSDLSKILEKVKDKPFDKYYQSKFWSTFSAYEEALKNETKQKVINRLKDNVEFMCNLNLADIKYM